MPEQKKSLIDKMLDYGLAKTLTFIYLFFLLAWALVMTLLHYYIKWRERL